MVLIQVYCSINFTRNQFCICSIITKTTIHSTRSSFKLNDGSKPILVFSPSSSPSFPSFPAFLIKLVTSTSLKVWLGGHRQFLSVSKLQFVGSPSNLLKSH